MPLKIHNIKTSTVVKAVNTSIDVASLPIKYPNNNIRFVYGDDNSVYKAGFRMGMFDHYDIENL